MRKVYVLLFALLSTILFTTHTQPVQAESRNLLKEQDLHVISVDYQLKKKTLRKTVACLNKKPGFFKRRTGGIKFRPIRNKIRRLKKSSETKKVKKLKSLLRAAKSACKDAQLPIEDEEALNYIDTGAVTLELALQSSGNAISTSSQQGAGTGNSNQFTNIVYDGSPSNALKLFPADDVSAGEYVVQGPKTIITSGFIPVAAEDHERSYELSGDFSTIHGSKFHFGLIPYDQNKNFIHPVEVNRSGDPLTIVGVKSPTELIISGNLTTWNGADTYASKRSIGFYFGGKISERPDAVFYPYKKWNSTDTSDGAYGSNASVNRLILNQPLPKNILDQIELNRTQIMNHFNGSMYIYSGAISKSLTAGSNVHIQSDPISGSALGEQITAFRPGTRFVKLIVLANTGLSASNDLRIDNMRFLETRQGGTSRRSLFEANISAHLSKPFENNTFHTIHSDQISGKDVFRVNGDATVISSDLFPIDPEGAYMLSGYFRSFGSGPSRMYYGLKVFDKNKKHITQFDVNRRGPSRIIQNLVESEIKVNEPFSGWESTGSRAAYRTVGFYFDGNTDRLPDYVYKPAAHWNSLKPTDGAYSKAEGFTLSLNGSLPASVINQIQYGKTAIMNHYAKGGTYQYFGATNLEVPHEWTRVESNTIFGELFGHSTKEFRKGTRYVQFVVLANYMQTKSQQLLFNDLTLTQLAGNALLTLPGDFNGDGVIDAFDIDLLQDALNGSIQSDPAKYDLNGDGAITFADKEFLVEEILNTYFGDTDLDGDVDFTDFGIFGANFGYRGGWADGNFTGGTHISSADYGYLAGNYGKLRKDQHATEDNCPYDVAKTKPGTCGCGIPDLDSDQDGFYNCQEECSSDAQKQDPGTCGCGKADQDNNNNGIIDCLEMNSSCSLHGDSRWLSDFNEDTVIDSSDYNIWRSNYGLTSPSRCDGDANGDGKVDSADYTVWRSELHAYNNPANNDDIDAEDPNVSPFEHDPVILGEEEATKKRWVVADIRCVKEGKVTSFFKDKIKIPADYNPASPITDSVQEVSVLASLTESELESKIQADSCIHGATNVSTTGDIEVQAFAVSDIERPNQKSLNDINFDAGYEKFKTLSSNWSQQTTVATIDTGFDFQNRDISRLISNARGANIAQLFDPRNENPDFPQDTLGHGTAVSSIIAATSNNGMGIAGIAGQSAQLLPLRIIRGDEQLMPNVSFRVFNSIQRAVNLGAEVINLSFSVNRKSSLCDPVIGHAIYKAIENGVFFTFSAGNGTYTDPNGVQIPGELIAPTDDGPQRFGNAVSPACWGRYFKGALTVASLETGTNQLASFSNYGEPVEIATPGSEILTYGLNNQLIRASGTSMSSAQVAAAASHVISVFKRNNWRYSPWLIEDVILNSSPIVEELGNKVNGGKVLDLHALANYVEWMGTLSESDRQRIPSENIRAGQGWKPDEGFQTIDRLAISAPKLLAVKGEFLDLKAQVLYLDGRIQDLEDDAYWTSSNSVQAPVNRRTGTVQFLKEGNYTLAVNYMGFSSTVSIRVTTSPVTDPLTGIQLSLKSNEVNWGERVEYTVMAKYGKLDINVTPQVTTTLSSTNELSQSVPGLIETRSAFGGKSYQLTVRLGSYSKTATFKVLKRNLSLEILSPLGNKVFQGQDITLQGALRSKTTIDALSSVVMWDAKGAPLGFSREESQALTLSTQNLPLGSYTVHASMLYRGNGTEQLLTDSFTFEVTDTYERLELVTKTPIISFNSRALFSLRVHFENNSYIVLDPKQVKWSTSDSAALTIDEQGIVYPDSNSLGQGNTPKAYQVVATYRGENISTGITIVPFNTVNGQESELLYITLEGFIDDGNIPYGRYFNYHFGDRASHLSTTLITLAHYADGTIRDVSDYASYSLSNGAPAYLAQPAFTANAPLRDLYLRKDIFGGSIFSVNSTYHGVTVERKVHLLKTKNPVLGAGPTEYVKKQNREIQFDLHSGTSRLVKDNRLLPFFGYNTLNIEITGTSPVPAETIAYVNKWRRLPAFSMPTGTYTVRFNYDFRGNGSSQKISTSFNLLVEDAPILPPVDIYAEFFAGKPTPTSDLLYEDPFTRFGIALVDAEGNAVPDAVDFETKILNRGDRTLAAGIAKPSAQGGLLFLTHFDKDETQRDLLLSVHEKNTGFIKEVPFTLEGVNDFKPNATVLPRPAAYNVASRARDTYCDTASKKRDDFSGGNGSRSNPFAICTIEQLQNIDAILTSKNFKWYNVAYIALRDHLDFLTHGNMRPIALGNHQIELDGRMHEIRNLTMVDAEADHFSLFQPFNDLEFTIRNLIVKEPYIRGASYTGALIGGDLYSIYAHLDNVHIHGGVVWGLNYVGGMVGATSISNITNSSVNGTEVYFDGQYAGGISGKSNNITSTYSSAILRASGVQGNQSHAGGITGTNANTIENCVFDGSIVVTSNESGQSYVGGISGFTNGRVIRSHSKGTITASGLNVGGIAGALEGNRSNDLNGVISESSSSMIINGGTGDGSILPGIQLASNVGGIAGYAKGMILDCTSSGSLKGDKYIGGLVGRANLLRLYRNSSSATLTSSSTFHGGAIGRVDETKFTDQLGNLHDVSLYSKNNSWTGSKAPGAASIAEKGTLRNIGFSGIVKR